MSMPLASLPASERAALARIVQAARLMDVLYMRQVWPGTASLVARLAVASGAPAQAQLEALLFRKGPWLPTGEAFIAGAPATRPPGDFYPPDSTKDEIDAWLKQLREGEHRQAMNPFRVLRREAAGRFASFPYSVIYGSELTLAARLLNEAAGLTREPTLQAFLAARARALLTDDYYASDVAFVGLRGALDVVFGPYEPDDDSWFETKTAFEASIGVVDEAATRRVASLSSHLQFAGARRPPASESWEKAATARGFL